MNKKILFLPLLLSCTSCGNTTSNVIRFINNEVYCQKNVESDNEGIKFDGFTKIYSKDASRSITYGTYLKGSTLSYKFKSKIISIYGYKGIEGGNVSIYIDNKAIGNYSCIDTSEKQSALICKIDNLTDDYHELKIKVSSENKWVAIDYLSVEIPLSVYQKYYNYALVGDIVTSRANPTGGGNKDLNTIRSEKIYPIGVGGFGSIQYDSFTKPGENVFYMGYTFNEIIPINKFIYQAGDTWATGGWFKNGLKIEALIDDEWINVTPTNKNLYPISDKYDDFIKNNIYYFYFENLLAKGIRIIGDAGGSDNFVSVSQLEVYCSKDAKSCAEGAMYTDEIHFE
ncbi:beta-lactamase [Firmicutes bacterium CAG:449]|nr:beta-lactamase [Firmicutes bacterium CAG:449]